MAVSGGVAAFAPRGRLPHISEAFRTGWNRTDRLSSWSGKDDKEGAPGGRSLLLGMCLIQLSRHTPIHFTIDARCRSIEICYGATGWITLDHPK